MKSIPIEIKVDDKQAQASLQDVVKSLELINETLVDNQKQSKDSFESLKKGAKSTQKPLSKISKGVSSLKKGFTGVGLAFKAIGFGLILKAFETFTEVLGQNQKVVDFGNTLFQTTAKIFTDITNGVIESFTSFENFKTAIARVGNSIKTLLMPTIIKAQIGFKTLQLAAKQLFNKKDTEGIERLSSEISSLVIDLADATKEQEELSTSITNYVSSTFKAAEANTILANNAKLLNAENQGLLEKYDRQSEIQRQLRDDTSNSIEERIAANKRLGEILDEQEKTMKQNAQVAVDSARQALNLNKDNIDLQVAYQESLNEQAAIEATVTGFRSEQQTNYNSLLQEQKDLDLELRQIGLEDIELAKLEAQTQLDDQIALINKEVENEIQKNILLAKAQKEFKDKIKKINEDAAKTDVKITKLTEEQKLGIISGALSGIANLVGQSSGFGKAIAVTQAIIDTYAGANKALAQGGIFGGIAAAGIIAGGLANVKTIVSTQTPNAPSELGGGGANSPSAPTIASTPPSFNVVGASETNQLAGAISSQAQKPVQAFVVSNDVTTAQSLERNIIQGATIG
tara:strand:+ start:11076 stop:12791 length:1716 start_codon:yes stop_codon:yes gene_type:complete